MKRRKTLLAKTRVLLIAGALALAACRAPLPAEGPGAMAPLTSSIAQVPWEILGESHSSRYKSREPALLVVRGPDDASYLKLFPAAWKAVHDADLSRGFIAVIFQGRKGTDGYSLRVREVRFDGRGLFSIYVDFLEPREGEKRIEKAMSPTTVVRVGPLNGDVSLDQFSVAMVGGQTILCASYPPPAMPLFTPEPTVTATYPRP